MNILYYLLMFAVTVECNQLYNFTFPIIITTVFMDRMLKNATKKDLIKLKHEILAELKEKPIEFDDAFKKDMDEEQLKDSYDRLLISAFMLTTIFYSAMNTDWGYGTYHYNIFFYDCFNVASGIFSLTYCIGVIHQLSFKYLKNRSDKKNMIKESVAGLST